MGEERSWVEKYGFRTTKEYVDYMTEHGLWGSEDYIASKGTQDKKLTAKEEEG